MARAKAKPVARKLRKNPIKHAKRVVENNAILKKLKA